MFIASSQIITKRNMLSEKKHSILYQFMSVAVQEYISRSELPKQIYHSYPYTMAGLFIYLCIKYKLVKECGKKFPSVHNKRKGKGWKRALTSNSTVETRYQASPSSNVEKQIQT